MGQNVTVDIRIESKDPVVIQRIAASLGAVNSEQIEPHRDVETIFRVTAEVIELLAALVKLWKEVKQRPEAPKVVIEVESGSQLEINRVENEDQIKEFMSEE
jgi:D-alanine-D-alanine ligase-like ATP-grasp enzyme